MKNSHWIFIVAGMFFFTLFRSISVHAEIVEYDLFIAQLEVNFTGKPAQGMTINGGIPGPTLRFKEGDTARIHVHNDMTQETSIHWHGLLVPPGMDGVPYVSFPPIKAGTVFTYEFPIRQTGTYWYHSHTGTQEQSGIYGSIVIEPALGAINYDRDYVILLSDWTDENPHKVNRTLRRGSEWYAIQKGSHQSITGAARNGMLWNYLKRNLQRMPAMDIADVAYHRFLANGESNITFDAVPGERIRLRIINGSATTYFYLEFAGDPLTIIAADGQDVKSVEEKRILIGVAETYDVLVKIPGPGAWEFRATAHDGSGHVPVWIGTGKPHPAPDVPKPNLYAGMGDLTMRQVFAITPAGSMGMSDRRVKAGEFDMPGMTGMGSMNMGGMEQGGHNQHADNSENHMEMDSMGETGQNQNHEDSKMAMDMMDSARPAAPYNKLNATEPTVISREKPVREIRLVLDGDMERYVWLLNKKPLSKSDSILIHRGEVVRFIMINRTMMNHPMHLHGHFFRVINNQGDYAPLKHTVDVAPMTTTVIEFEANEFGDWFFHCHLLYHMKNGMARVVHYEGFTPNPDTAAVQYKLYKDPWYFWGEADVISNMTSGLLTLSNSSNIFNAEWDAGWQKVDVVDWEGIVTWERPFNRFFSIFGGADVLGVGDDLENVRAVFGFQYLMPFNLELRVWIDSSLGARFNLEKTFVLTQRLELIGEVQYDTHEEWEGETELSFTVLKDLSLIGRWQSDYGLGGGLTVRF
jgi:CopA family copper-resistance protein